MCRNYLPAVALTLMFAWIMAVMASPAFAQRSFRGGDRDDDRGSERRRSGDSDDRRRGGGGEFEGRRGGWGGDREEGRRGWGGDSEGRRGGWGGDSGSRRGGGEDRGGDGSARGGDRPQFDPAEMLRRFDNDRNGTLEGEELEGRRGDFLRRILEGTGLENQSRISVEQATKEVERVREEREKGIEAASMSFGTTSDVEPAASFDAPPPTTGKALEERFEQRTIEYVDRMMERYDTNKNHYIDGSEWANMRWRGDPREADTNKDGRLSREELCVSLEKSFGSRERDDDQARSESRGDESGDRRSRGWSRGDGRSRGESSDDASSDRFRQHAEQLMRQHDTNGNNVLEKEEQSGLRNAEAYDQNGDGKITIEEITSRIASYAQGRSSRDGGRRSGRGGSGRGQEERKETQPTYRFLSPVERLPRGLPDWFIRNDRDGDGQIMMHEFSTTWSAAKVAEFNDYDLNGDGIITPQECLEALR